MRMGVAAWGVALEEEARGWTGRRGCNDWCTGAISRRRRGNGRTEDREGKGKLGKYPRGRRASNLMVRPLLPSLHIHSNMVRVGLVLALASLSEAALVEVWFVPLISLLLLPWLTFPCPRQVQHLQRCRQPRRRLPPQGRRSQWNVAVSSYPVCSSRDLVRRKSLMLDVQAAHPRSQSG